MEQTVLNSRSPAAPVSRRLPQNVQQCDQHLKQTSTRRQQRRSISRASRQELTARQKAAVAFSGGGLGALLVDALLASPAAAADLVAQVTMTLLVHCWIWAASDTAMRQLM